jgi:sugar (glycoside-pentoside-hexuronide) transporter
MNAAPLSRKTLLGYSAGSLVETSIYGFCGLYLLNFYTDVVHLDSRLIGYAFAIRFFVDAASDPAIGYLSDKTRTRLGRRRPYFLLGAIPGAVAFYLLLTPPPGAQSATFVYLTLASTGMLFALTVFGIPYHALAWELTSNYDERTRIATWRRVAEVGAELLATLTIPLLLVWAASRNPEVPPDEAQFYPSAALLIGGTAVVAAIITFFGTSEIRRTDARDQYGFRESLATAYRNKPFMILLATGTLVAVADQVAMSLLFYLMEHQHGVPKQNANLLFLAFFAGSLVSPPGWLFLGKRFGKKRAYLLAILFWMGAFTSLVVNAWSETTLYLVAALMGVASSGVFLLPDAILPDVIEWDQLRTGERHEGMYAGVTKFSWKVGTGACFFVVGHFLHIIGYDGKSEPTTEVLNGLRLFYAAFPGLLLTLAMIVFSFFPITAESFRKMVADLEKQRT